MSVQKFESDFLPVLPLKELVVFPGAVTPLFVMRPVSLLALEEALKREKRVFLTCQKQPDLDEPGIKDLYEVGTVAEVLQVLRVPDGSAKVLVEGVYAARAIEVSQRGGYLQAFVVLNQMNNVDRKAIQAQQRRVLELFSAFAEMSGKIPADLLANIKSTRDPQAFANAVANYATFRIEDKQQILEENSLEEKYHLMIQCLESENQILDLENKIAGQVKNQIGKSQREYYLNEQLKAIERELGIGAEEDPEISELSAAIENSGMPEEARDKAEKELGRLSRMPSMSPEAVVTRTYIEWLAEVPWTKETTDKIDLEYARRVLDKDHHGLERIKDRILEHLAVVKLAGQGRGPILCFVGPPGVGKTSLGKSIARCVGREFIRVSLGGVRDEAEIRGHRRTYVGALPGKIIQSMKRAGTINPVFLLDEIDKMSSDFRGDPSSAMLEVLDPEQNRTFNDHYLEVDYDLSKVMFLTTANTVDGIPYPLLDRMELIRLAGYTEQEKLQIAVRHLIPRQRKAHGLKAAQIRLPRPGIAHLISAYTREAGVRNLDRTIAQVCRKVVTEVVRHPRRQNFPPITPEKLREYLGPVKFPDQHIVAKAEVGIALGLAWTEVGGEILPVETTLMSGKGTLTLTGKLGEVMQESAKTALSYVRAHAKELGIDPDFLPTTDIHIHVPEGAIPKDGPSAGITMATSLASALGKIPVRQDLAMTGEMTLRGRVLRIGGLKEKVLAAHRRNLRTIIIPRENEDELEEIAADIRRELTFLPVETLDEVFAAALQRPREIRARVTRRTRGSSSRVRGTA